MDALKIQHISALNTRSHGVNTRKKDLSFTKHIILLEKCSSMIFFADDTVLYHSISATALACLLLLSHIYIWEFVAGFRPSRLPAAEYGQNVKSQYKSKCSLDVIIVSIAFPYPISIYS